MYQIVGVQGFEPWTCGLKVQCSTNWAIHPLNNYIAKRIKKAIIKANKAIASVNAKPINAILN